MALEMVANRMIYHSNVWTNTEGTVKITTTNNFKTRKPLQQARKRSPGGNAEIKEITWGNAEIKEEITWGNAEINGEITRETAETNEEATYGNREINEEIT